MKLPFWSVLLLALGIVSTVNAEPNLEKLKGLVGAEPDTIAETPIPGLYEVVLDTQILYVSTDGNYVVSGDMIDLTERNNLTETRRNDLRRTAIEKVGEDNMVIFAPKGPARHTVSVFTDIDCGYCRQLHREITSYNDLGIRIRYLAFPRAGIGSDSYDKAVTVWCSDDRQEALTLSKQGERLDAIECANPVADQYQLGQALGVRGTPSIILENGELVPGYVPAARLAQILDGNATAAR